MHRAALSAVVLIACGRPEPSIEWPAPGQSKLLLHEERVENAYPRLSRDARSVLYQSNRSGHWQLYVLDVRTGASRQVMATTSNETLPDWSPDGRSIAFVSDRDGNEEVYVMQADGTGQRRITTSPGRDIHPYWSPDGRALLINASRPTPMDDIDVYRVDVATLASERVTSTPHDDTCARYTRDGSRIVLLRNDARSDDIVELEVATGAVHDVTQTPRVRDGWPTYSPDGAWIYYASMAAGPFSLYRVGRGGPPQQLTFAGNGEEDARPFVSADGGLVVYNKRVGEAIDILVLRVPA